MELMIENENFLGILGFFSDTNLYCLYRTHSP